MKHAYTITIECGVRSPGHGTEVVDELNTANHFFTNVNRKCATFSFQRVWNSDGNTHQKP